MRYAFSILITVLTSTIGFCQNDSIRGNQFELVGKIIGEVSIPPHCGSFAWGTVVEFEISEFNDSTYQPDSIGVIFTCPEFYGEEFFEVGKAYKVIVADENQANFGWTIPNESILTKYDLDKRLWVLNAIKISEHEY